MEGDNVIIEEIKEIDKMRPHEKKLSQVKIDFLCGGIAGVVQVLIGQPLDIVKIRLQAQHAETRYYSGVIDCIKQITAKEGSFAFYKGILPPVLGACACVSIQFGVVESIKRSFEKLKPPGVKDLPLSYVCLSGSMAGLANSVVTTPAGQLKIRMQMQRSGSVKLYKNSIDCALQIYRRYGIKGIYKGAQITMLREIVGFGAYFCMYEKSVRYFLKPGQERIQLNPLLLLLSGAIGGYSYWLLCYPLDSVKTKIQFDSFTKPRFTSIVDCIVQTKNEGGIPNFYRGLVPCLLRAGPVNAGGFFTFEYLKDFFKRKDHENSFS